VTEYQ